MTSYAESVCAIYNANRVNPGESATMDRIDQTTITQQGITFEVILAPDLDTTPDDYDPQVYADNLDGWKRDDWRFVDVTVAPVIDGETMADVAFTLGGVEWGYASTWTVTTEDIAKRAVDEGWTAESMDQLRAYAGERAAKLGEWNSRMDRITAAVMSYAEFIDARAAGEGR